MVAKSQLGRAYEYVYGKLCGIHPYQRLWHFQWLATAYLHRQLKPVLSRAGGRVLDVGCGGKPYKSWLDKGADYVGLDIEGVPGADITIDAKKCWPLEDNSFDVIISNQALEHVEYFEHTLSEMQRVMSPGGLMILSFPFLYNEHGAPWDFRRFTKHLAGNLFPGYEIELLKTQGAIGSTLGLLLLNWLEDISNSSLITRLLKGLLLPAWMIIAAFVNVLALLLDKIDNTDAYYNNVLLVVRKPVSDHVGR